ncbi:MAG: sulfotransferase [Pseudomonadota bacterium]
MAADGSTATASDSAPSSSAADSVARRSIQTLLEAARFDDALAATDAALKLARTADEQAPLHYLRAVALRYGGRAADALAAINAHLVLSPNNARGYQEQGHILRELKRLRDARGAYEQALRHNPSLLASWNALLPLLQGAADAQRRAVATAEIRELERLPAPLLQARSFLHEGRLEEADDLCRRFLAQHKTHPDGMRLLARILAEGGVLVDAEFLLETLLALPPQPQQTTQDDEITTAACYELANLKLRMQKFEAALSLTDALVERSPDHLPYLALHANALAGVGRSAEAIDTYNRVLERSPEQPQLLVMRGHAEKTLGDAQAAQRSYQQAYERSPCYGDAYWSLANTKAYRFSDDEITAMRTAEADPATATDDRVHLCFALGKAFEDRGAFEDSFVYYERGNRLKQASVSHRAEYLVQRRETQQHYFTRERFAALLREGEIGHPDPAPIFIVGLPRAGSTLLEQILASHSAIDGTMELPHIISLVQRLRRGGRRQANPQTYPELLDSLSPDLLRRFGEQFIEQTRIYRGSGTLFIDKNPNNFFHVGLIRLMLPNAKIIDARRHPMACCFSGFKQLFGQGQEFSYGLTEIGTYYREYVALMDHWDQVLPGFVLRVQHEDVLDDLEGEVRRMLAFCDVPFEAQCLEFHRTERQVRTPSSEQVRQPLFRTSIDTWTHYDAWLDPLKIALGADVRERFAIADPETSAAP